MNLFGPISTVSLGGKYYRYVIMDDYFRYTWVHFLRSKNEAFQIFAKFNKSVQKKKSTEISKVRSDHGKEFENLEFKSFYEDHGITHQFSTPRTPQQNGVVERKNRTLIEMARSMLCENRLPKYFWVETVNTACYITN